jgi:hypothetical protein
VNASYLPINNLFIHILHTVGRELLKMRKQELIHMHALVTELSEYLMSTGEDIDIEAYEGLHTSPIAIHQSKTAHAEAVMTLSQCIVDGIEGEGTVEHAAPAN